MAVSSSNLVSVGYEESTQTLEVEFKEGRVYQYFGVPAPLHDQLIGATSVGKFFNGNIRDVFPHEQVG